MILLLYFETGVHGLARRHHAAVCCRLYRTANDGRYFVLRIIHVEVFIQMWYRLMELESVSCSAVYRTAHNGQYFARGTEYYIFTSYLPRSIQITAVVAIDGTGIMVVLLLLLPSLRIITDVLGFLQQCCCSACSTVQAVVHASSIRYE